ncbi:MAG: hypothetical protein J5594_05750 [Elusimicrobiaceae bacterium]|nr:hypothetical protein [Elusimicrobiaceae bacterium]
MLLTANHLNNVYETGAQMRRLVENYYTDLGAWLDVPFLIYYRFVCDLPYIKDPDDIEFISRARLTLNPFFNIARDCDDKSVLLACWWHGHGDGKRFVASSTKPNKSLHHVFMQLENGIFCDATYPKNKNFFGVYPFFEKITRLAPLTDYF